MSTNTKTISIVLETYKDLWDQATSGINQLQNAVSSLSAAKQDLEIAFVSSEHLDEVVNTSDPKTWFEALRNEQNPHLKLFHTSTELTIKGFGFNQNAAAEKLQEHTSRAQLLNEQLKNAQDQLLNSHRDSDQAYQHFHETAALKIEHHDHFLDKHMDAWMRSSSRWTPLEFDHQAPQPFWAKPWLLAIINPARARYMEQANQFEKESNGLNLKLTSLTYPIRKETAARANAAVSYGCDIRSTIEDTIDTLVDSIQQNSLQLEKAQIWLASEESPTFRAKNIASAYKECAELVVRYCIRHNISSVGSLPVSLLDSAEYDEKTNSIITLDNRQATLRNEISHYKELVNILNQNIENLERLKYKKGSSAKVSMDFSHLFKSMAEMNTTVDQSRSKTFNPAQQSSHTDSNNLISTMLLWSVLTPDTTNFSVESARHSSQDDRCSSNERFNDESHRTPESSNVTQSSNDSYSSSSSSSDSSCGSSWD